MSYRRRARSIRRSQASTAVLGRRDVVSPRDGADPSLNPPPSAELAHANPGHNFANISVLPPAPVEPVQTKLAVSQPGDRYEQEADRVADSVMRMPAPVAAVGTAAVSITAQPRMAESLINRQFVTPLAPGGGYKGLMERDRRRAAAPPSASTEGQGTEEPWYRVYGGTEINASDDYAASGISRKIGDKTESRVALVGPRGSYAPPAGWDLDCFIRRDGTATKFPGIAAYAGLSSELTKDETRSAFGQYLGQAEGLFSANPKPAAPAEQQPAIQRLARDGAAPDVVPAAVMDTITTRGGQFLDEPTRAFFEPRLGHDFSRVRVHADHDAATQATALGAHAFTAGDHVFFGAGAYQPRAAAGRRLIAHELVHVVQQRGAPAAAAGVQRKIVPEDVAVEMIGREFTLSADHSVGGVTLKAGTVVKAVSWSNASDTIAATGAGIKGSVLIPKTLLRPVRAAVAGVAPYGAGVSGQATAVEAAEQKLAAWTANEASYKSAKAVALYKAERTRLEGLLTKKREVLNRRLIQQTMFNRFDAIIKKEVDAANSAHGLKGAAALDPNLLKSMLFQESQLGTAGEHLEQPPSHPVKTRFNLGQVIDSSGMALLTMLEKEHPVVISFFLPSMRADLAAAQTERAALKKKKTLTAAETARLATLDSLAGQNWEVFIWGYKASGLTGAKFADVVALFFGSTAPARNLDYEFWIHMAVLWLFEKHKAGMSWPQTIKAYNGSGKRAEHYRDAVIKRAADAAAAAKAGKDFVPGGI